MQRVELNAFGIVDGRSAHFAERRPQNIHAWNDAELRNQRKGQHEAKKDISRCKDMCSSVGQAAVEHRTDQEDDSGDNGNPVQLAQSPSDNVACEVRCGQNREGSRCEHEGKENQTADPDDQRQEHEKTQEGHSGVYYHGRDREAPIEKVDELISKAVAAFRSAPSSGDAEIYRKLVGEGVQPEVAARLVEFVPMAYCRLMLARSGVRFADTYRRRFGDGRVSAERPLSSEPVWDAAMAFGRCELDRNVPPEDLLAVGMHSAEFDAVNQLLNKGSNLKDVVLTPTSLTWQHDGPEN